MIGGKQNLRVWAYPAPCDLRKGFNGLYGLVQSHLCREVLGGDFYLFVNRRRKAAKILFWDGTGLCILHKRLETKGSTFPRLWARQNVDVTSGIAMSMSELNLFLEGCKLLETHSLKSEDQTLKVLASSI